MSRILQILWILVYVAVSAFPVLGLSMAGGAVCVLLLKVPLLAFNLPRYDWIIPLSVLVSLATFLVLSWIEQSHHWTDTIATRISDWLVPGGSPTKKIGNA